MASVFVPPRSIPILMASYHTQTVIQTHKPVVLLRELSPGALAAVLGPYGLAIDVQATGEIAGSYWGESEAGLIGNRLIVRPDTPVHSALHEACHWICAKNRDGHPFPPGNGVRHEFAGIHTDAGGDDLEECGVCYLQILLADRVAGYSRERMLADMDAWGYSFRLGSAKDWFERDAEDALEWLTRRGVLPA